MPGASKTFAIVGLVLLGGCASATASVQRGAQDGARNVILMVADGAGLAYWSAARHVAGSLAVEEFPVTGLVDTWDVEGRITDSAAGASAYATGRRTFYRAVSVGPECQALLRADEAALRREPGRCLPLESLFDVAEGRGMATGVVTTAAVVDATPAAFVASSPHRDWYDYIAAQLARAELEVVLGGGREYFDGSRPGTENLLDLMCADAACLTTADELESYRPDDRPLVGLFAPGLMAPAGSREPALPRMVEAALERLGDDPEGFVALFESEGTDGAGHNNEPLATIAAEMLEFDAAVAVALDFARRTPGTLLVVTSDHETGGFTLPQFARGDPLIAAYTTEGHTGVMVPLFAFGPGAERFGGIRENHEVGALLRESLTPPPP